MTGFLRSPLLVEIVTLVVGLVPGLAAELAALLGDLVGSIQHLRVTGILAVLAFKTN